METKGWRVADDRRRPVRDLANGAVGLCLSSGVSMEGFDGRKTNKRRQSKERREAHKPFHGVSIAVQNHFCQ